jgi:hypothetical protein
LQKVGQYSMQIHILGSQIEWQSLLWRLGSLPGHGRAAHQVRMQYAQLRGVTVRRGGRHIEPGRTVGKLNRLAQIEFGWITAENIIS